MAVQAYGATPSTTDEEPSNHSRIATEKPEAPSKADTGGAADEP